MKNILTDAVYKRSVICLFLLSAAIFVTPLVLKWNQISLPVFDFRQTQTALTTLWLARGGPIIDYQTPVFGAPWTLPLEFPTYQVAVAILYRWTGLSLNQAGRLFSFVMMALTILPSISINRRIFKDDTALLVMWSLILASPIYAFWAASFMIESTALFLSVWFVAILLAYLERPGIFLFVLMTLTASLAAVTKITTLVAFALAGALLVLHDYAQRVRAGRHWLPEGLAKSLARYAGPALAMAITVAVLVIWVNHSDHIKEQSALGSVLTSSALTRWNYGTWGQLFSRDMIVGRLLQRMPSDFFGSPLWVVGPILAGSLILARKATKYVAVLVALFLSSIAIFTNLHFVHSYYQNSNAIFVLAAAGIIVWMLREFSKPLSILALAVLISCQAWGLKKNYYQFMIQDSLNPRTAEIAKALQKETTEDEIFISFGNDWSSEIPYYAERRAIMVPDWLPIAPLKKLQQDPDSFAGGAKIGAVVLCPNTIPKDDEKKPIYDEIVAAYSSVMHSSNVADCIMLSAHDS